MDCDVCFHPYNEEERQPRTMHCGHTLCNVCITESIKNAQLVCPFCRVIHSVAIATDIPINFSMLKVLRTVPRGEALLENSMKQFSPSSLEPELHAGICAEHGSYKLFWCGNCKVWICRDCTVVEHPVPKCAVSSIKKALDQIKEEETSFLTEVVQAGSIHIGELANHQQELKSHYEQHNKHIKDLSKDIEHIKSVMDLLKKEEARTESVVLDGQDVIEKMTLANNNLKEKERVDDITVARHLSQQRYKEVKNWIKSSKDDLEGVKINKISEELNTKLEILLKIKDIENKYLSVLPTFIDILQKLQTNPQLDDLHCIVRVTNAFVMSDSKQLLSPIKLINGDCYIHAEPSNPPHNGVSVPMKSILPIIGDRPKVFMNLSHHGATLGLVTIQLGRLEPGSYVESFFKRFCIGSYEEGNSLVHSKMIKVLDKGGQQYRLCGGYNGVNDPVEEPCRGKSGFDRTGQGSVTVAVIKNTQCFNIYIRDYANYDKVMGKVISGLDVVKKAAEVSNVQEVIIDACGIILSSNSS